VSLCQNGVSRPLVAEEGDGLQIRTVVVNIVNNQSRTADRGCNTSLLVGRRLTTSHPKTTDFLRNGYYNLPIERFLPHELAGSGECVDDPPSSGAAAYVSWLVSYY
jgi:hypothetical protein